MCVIHVHVCLVTQIMLMLIIIFNIMSLHLSQLY